MNIVNRTTTVALALIATLSTASASAGLITQTFIGQLGINEYGEVDNADKKVFDVFDSNLGELTNVGLSIMGTMSLDPAEVDCSPLPANCLLDHNLIFSWSTGDYELFEVMQTDGFRSYSGTETEIVSTAIWTSYRSDLYDLSSYSTGPVELHYDYAYFEAAGSPQYFNRPVDFDVTLTYEFEAAAVPNPSTLALILLAMGCTSLRRARGIQAGS